MSTEERARILRMVAENTLSAEEAADLLDAVEASTRPEPVPQPYAARPAFVTPDSLMGQRGKPRSLVIQIEEGGDSRVHLRIPLGLARAAGKFVPRQAQRRLEEFEIDLAQLLDDLGSASVEGPLIQIEDGDSRVHIAVE